MQALYLEIGIARPTLTRLLELLERSDALMRDRDQQDHRRTHVILRAGFRERFDDCVQTMIAMLDFLAPQDTRQVRNVKNRKHRMPPADVPDNGSGRPLGLPSKTPEKCQGCLYYLSLSCVASKAPDSCGDIFSPRALGPRSP